MNKIINILLFTALVAAAGCSKDKEGPVSTQSEAAVEGSWMITYFADEKDETEIFKEYVFGFQSGGALRLSKGSESYSGTWGQVSSSGKTLINLRISAAGLVQRLAGDWEIISVTDDALQLSDPNGGNNKVMHLARR